MVSFVVEKYITVHTPSCSLKYGRVRLGCHAGPLISQHNHLTFVIRVLQDSIIAASTVAVALLFRGLAREPTSPTSSLRLPAT